MPGTREPIALASFPPDGVALVIGASGGIGSALEAELAGGARFAHVFGSHRAGPLALDLTDEASIAETIGKVATRGEIRLAMLGMIEGNGHPYSWSAIINGYNYGSGIAIHVPNPPRPGSKRRRSTPPSTSAVACSAKSGTS